MCDLKEIDCLGEICPIPVLRIKKALKSMKPNDTVKVVTDHSCVLQSILNTFEKKSLILEYEEVINGVWEIFITKN